MKSDLHRMTGLEPATQGSSQLSYIRTPDKEGTYEKMPRVQAAILRTGIRTLYDCQRPTASPVISDHSTSVLLFTGWPVRCSAMSLPFPPPQKKDRIVMMQPFRLSREALMQLSHIYQFACNPQASDPGFVTGPYCSSDLQALL